MTKAARSTRERKTYARRMPIELRREQLLDAAITIIARDGYDKVSIDAIARECDITRPVVYSAYDGLAPLLHDLLDRSQRKALAAIESILGDADLTDPDRFLLEATRGLIDAVQAEPDIWRPIVGLTQGAPPEVRERVAADRARIQQRIAKLLKLGLLIRGGPKLDAEVTSHMLLAALEHFGRLVLDEPDRFPPDRLVDAMRMLLAGLTPRASR